MQTSDLIHEFNTMTRRELSQDAFLNMLTAVIDPLWRETIARSFPGPDQNAEVVTMAEWHDRWQSRTLPGYGDRELSPRYIFDYQEEACKARPIHEYQEQLQNFQMPVITVPFATDPLGVYCRTGQYGFFPNLQTVLDALAARFVRRMEKAYALAKEQNYDYDEMTLLVTVPTPHLKLDIVTAEFQFSYIGAGTLHKRGQCPGYPED